MSARTQILVISSFFGYFIFVLYPLTLSTVAIAEGIGAYTILIVGLDMLLILPMILFFKKKKAARVLLGILSVVFFLLFSILPVLQHKADLTFKFDIFYGSILFLFAYIFYVMFIYKDTKNYFIKKF